MTKWNERDDSALDGITTCAARGEACGDSVMAVMIALVYDEERGGVPQRFFELERKYRQEVVSSLHVQLENNHRMEVIVVPGSVRVLKEIMDRILSCEGVTSCKLHFTDIIIPQVHSAGKRLRHVWPGWLKVCPEGQNTMSQLLSASYDG